MCSCGRTHFKDLVAFAQTDADRDNVPPDFTTYTITELMEVFGDGTPSPGSLKLIHEAKKHGGRIIGGGCSSTLPVTIYFALLGQHWVNNVKSPRISASL